jgi:hypothetical protein
MDNVKPLDRDDLKSFWKQAYEYNTKILAAALRSDLYHRAMLAKAEHQLQHRDRQTDSCDECKTTDQWIIAEAQRLGIDLK